MSISTDIQYSIPEIQGYNQQKIFHFYENKCTIPR